MELRNFGSTVCIELYEQRSKICCCMEAIFLFFFSNLLAIFVPPFWPCFNLLLFFGQFAKRSQ